MSDLGDLSDHAAANQKYWDASARSYASRGQRIWGQDPVWGVWSVSQDVCPILPEDMSGLDAIELGCGTGYVSAWMARRGAAVVGIDISEQQLATAHRMLDADPLPITFVHGQAEHVPYPDASFDFAISEYGASLWCEPEQWLREAHRLLRPGAPLVFLSMSTLAFLASPKDGSLPVTEAFERSYFDMHRFDWTDAVDDPGGIEFGMPIGKWFELFRDIGFDVEDFREIQNPDPSAGTRDYVTAEWAHRFPCEQVWFVRKRS